MLLFRISPSCALALCFALSAATLADSDPKRVPAATARQEAKLEAAKRERVRHFDDEVKAAERFLATVEKAAVRRDARGDPEIGPFTSPAGKHRALDRAKARVDRSRRELAVAEAVPAAAGAVALVRDVGEIGVPAQQDFRIWQIIGEEDMIADNFPERVWLHGFPTEGLVDGRIVKITRPVVVSGTKHYAGNTMLLVEPYTPSPPADPPAAPAQDQQKE